MKILLIGSGNRAKAYASYLKDEIAYVSDVAEGKAEMLIREYSLSNAVSMNDYTDCHDADAIIIAVPDYCHEEAFEWAIGQKVPILLEKPVAVTNSSLKRFYELGSGYRYGIILGFTLRYTFMYKKIIELLENKVVGEVISVEASETLDSVHAAKFFRRWHRFSKYSGGFLNTKCSHDLDIINQLVPGKPLRVSSFGNNTVFRPGRGQEKCNENCIEYTDCRYVDKNTYRFSTADPGLCPYNVESDIVDHQVVAIEFESGATAVFTVSMHSDKGDRHIRIHGTSGSIAASFHNQNVYLLKPGELDMVYEPEKTSGSHGGGDEALCRSFLECIRSGGGNQITDGIIASALALAADESRKTGKAVDMNLFTEYMLDKK